MMEKIHGGDIYGYNRKMLDFSANISPLGIPDEVKKAIAESVAGADIYPDTEYRRLREAVGGVEKVKADNIICGNGAAELIFNIVLALKPKRALIMSPTFAEYEKAVDTMDCEKIFYTLREKDGFEVRDDYLEMTDKADMVFICRPNNPTGYFMPTEFLRKVLDRCERNGTFVVVDECFTDFVGNSESIVKYIGEYKNLLVLKAFTKMFAVPGVRLGYGICSDRNIIEKMYAVRQPWSVSHTAEEAGIAACGIYERTVRETVSLIERERKYITSELKRLGVKYFEPTANYILFKAYEGLKGDMAARGILIRDCGNYRGLDGGFYRTAVKAHEDNRLMISALEECLWQRR